MRTLLATLALALSFSLSASHLITGHFSFEHVSTGTNTSVYEVSLVLYRDVTGVAMPTSVTVYYEKLGPNGVTSTLSLGQASSGALAGNCGSTYGIDAYTYSANVTSITTPATPSRILLVADLLQSRILQMPPAKAFTSVVF